MSGYLRGSGYIGSKALQTSVAGQEIIPSGYQLIRFELINDHDCSVSINGADYVFIKANQGVKIYSEDFAVNSVKIKENSKTFVWNGVWNRNRN